MQFDWSILVDAIAAVVALGGFGLSAVAVTQSVKDVFSLEGTAAQVLAWFVSIVVAIGGLILDGSITPELFNTESAAVVIGLVSASAKVFYETLKKAGIV